MTTVTTTVATALPILPGRSEEWRRIVQEATGPRRAELDDMHRRLGVDRATWVLQQTPHGDLAIIVLEGAGAPQAFPKWGQSQHPFDVWFKEKIGATYGLDLSQPPSGPAPETLYEFQA